MLATELAPSRLLDFLREMLFIRVFEQKVEAMIKASVIPGSVHLAIGQEAVAVGVMQALLDTDYAAGPHRGHHILLAKGLDPNVMMAELIGKATGFSAGKGGHMHMADVTHNMLGVNGIVGAPIALATGAAFTAQYRNRDQVAVAFFGDGGANKGQFHENLNMASILNLPAIYVCENNQYAVETAVTYSTGGNDIAGRAAAYGFPGVKVDGLDVLAMYEAAAQARKRAVEERRPTLIEAVTYRFKGHHMGDVENYRTKAEVAEWMKKDPIGRLHTLLTERGILDEAGWTAMQEEVKQRVEEAAAFGQNSPDPAPETGADNVYGIEVSHHA